MSGRNPRQQELAKRLQEMDDFACSRQNQLIEKVGEEGFNNSKGMWVESFLASYREQFKVGYASKRYFDDKVTIGKFFKTDLAHFKVSEEFYKEWLEGELSENDERVNMSEEDKQAVLKMMMKKLERIKIKCKDVEPLWMNKEFRAWQEEMDRLEKEGKLPKKKGEKKGEFLRIWKT